MKHTLMILLPVLLFLLPVFLNAQLPCKASFNAALARYQRGQFETIAAPLNACVVDIKTNRNEYLNNTNGKSRSAAFKVYKLIINTYRNLGQDNLATAKMNELFGVFNSMRRDMVQAQLNATPLQPIE